MPGRRQLLRGAGIGAAATPIAMALLFRWGTGGAPPQARATIDDGPSASQVMPLPKLTEAQVAVVTFARSAMQQPFGASPLHGAAPIVETTEESTAPTNVVPVEVPAPSFHVKSVLVSSKGALATVNGRLRRVGDEIEPQWTLAKIDVDAGILVISGPRDRTIEVPIHHLVK